MKRSAWIFGWTVVGALLLSMLSFPLGFDQAIFEAGGAAIGTHRAVPFRDFLELKQPLIFYLYSIATILFGRAEWAPRIIDIIYHAVALLILYRVLRSATASREHALLSVLTYTVLYVGSGFWMTMEPESYSVLPQLGFLYALLELEKDSRRPIWVLVSIVAIGLWSLVMLKATMAMMFGVVLVELLFADRLRRAPLVKFFVWTAAIFAVVLGATLLLLRSAGALENLVMSMQWLSSYASYYPLFGIHTFQEFYYHTFPSAIATTLSPTVLVLSAVTVAWLFRSPRLRKERTTFERMLMICCAGVFCGLLSVAFERKAFNYQFTRFFWALSPLVAHGVIIAWRRLSQSWVRSGAVGKVGMALLVLLACMFSPLPRLVDQAGGWTVKAIRGDEAGRLEKERNYNYDVGEMRMLAAKYRSELHSDGQLLVWGNAAQLYREFGQTPHTIELVNAMFMTAHTPSVWIDTLASQWRRQRPTLFICEQNDARPLITRTTDDSYLALRKIPALWNVVAELYQPIDSTAHFRVYRYRTESIVPSR